MTVFNKLRTLVTVTAVAYAIPLFAGMFNVELSGFMTIVAGLAMFIAIVWMLFIVYGSDFTS